LPPVTGFLTRLTSMKHYFATQYYVSSRLEAGYQEELEELFYFNRNQSRIREALRDAVQRYGTPQIRRNGDHLSLELATIPHVQALYVFQDGPRPGLVGVVVFSRKDSLLRVIYIGLDPQHAYTPERQDYLLVELVRTLREIGRKIRGVEAVEFSTGRRSFRLTV